jgi:protein SCO1/2
VKRHFEKKATTRFFIGVLVGIFLELGATQELVHAASDAGTAAPAPNTAAPKTASAHAGDGGNTVTADAPAKQVELKGNKNTPNAFEDIGVKEHLGETLDLEHLEFIDANDGQKHKLKEYFSNGKPTLINLVYFECPMLCTLVLNGVKDGMKDLDWSIGKQYNVLTVSINPSDTSAMAKFKRENYLKSYLENNHDAALANSGWHFLTGTEDQIKKLAAGLGFEYKYDTVQKEFAHPAVTFVLTPTGEISRYLYGITYKPKDLRLALLEASEGKVGNVFDRMLMFCYHYEPSSRGYTLQAVRVMQAGGVGTVAIFGTFLGLFWTRQRKGRMK